MQKSIRPKEIIRKRNRRLITVTALLIYFLITFYVVWWYQNRNWVTTDDAFITGNLVTVKAQTEGTVVEILTENTQKVTKGQVLVRLDGSKANIALHQAQAKLGETVRHLVALKKNADSLQQRLQARRAELNRFQHDMKRFHAAGQEGAISGQQIQNTQDQMVQLRAEMAAIRSEKAAIEARILGVSIDRHPSVENAKSDVRRAYLEFQRRMIVAPTTGYVAKRRVQIGDQVKADSSLLVIIPLDDLWVEANLLETKLADIRPGQTAEIIVDAYGKDYIHHGIVEGINPGTGSVFALLPTDNASGNFIHIAERIPVRISLDRNELKQHPLQPGLSTFTRINITDFNHGKTESQVKLDSLSYRTDVYEHELDGAENLINDVIHENLVPFD